MISKDNKLYQSELLKSCYLNIDWERFKSKKIMITGASGLIGSFIIDLIMMRNERFHNNISIVAIGRSDIDDYENLKQYKHSIFFTFVRQDIIRNFIYHESVDYIIHAASNTHPISYANDPIGTITTNIIGTLNVLNYATTFKVKKTIFLSSVEIYGENRGDINEFDESYCGYIDSNTLRAGYPESKRTAESLCQAFIRTNDLDIVIARLARIYGPTFKSNDSKVVSQFINNALNNEDIILKSKGDQFYSFTYVVDAVYAIFILLIKGIKGEAYNVSDSKSDCTILNLANIVSDLVGRKVIFDTPSITELIGFSKATKAIMNSSKIKKLGWNANYSIKEGIQNTLSILISEKINIVK